MEDDQLITKKNGKIVSSFSADDWLTGAVSVLVAFIASSGFWSYFNRRDVKKSATTRLLLGLAHDRLIYLGEKYIARGWLSTDEYEDYVKYLWEPYSEFGGNGLAERIYKEVQSLPIHGPVLPVIPRQPEERHVG